MNLKFNFWLLLFFFPSFLLAQSPLNEMYNEYMRLRWNDPTYWSTVRGSPYEEAEFKKAIVYFRGNLQGENGALRYNQLFDEMEMPEEGSDRYLIVDKKETIDSILMDGKTYRYFNFQDGKDITRGYFLQLNTGKCNLLLKKSREFQPEKIPTGGYQDYVPPSILVNPERFYIQFEGKMPELLPQSSKNIVKIFHENGYNISSYAKSNKIKYNKESLIPLINYCNKL